jgi:hypothetical protein
MKGDVAIAIELPSDEPKLELRIMCIVFTDVATIQRNWYAYKVFTKLVHLASETTKAIANMQAGSA